MTVISRNAQLFWTIPRRSLFSTLGIVTRPLISKIHKSCLSLHGADPAVNHAAIVPITCCPYPGMTDVCRLLLKLAPCVGIRLVHCIADIIISIIINIPLAAAEEKLEKMKYIGCSPLHHHYYYSAENQKWEIENKDKIRIESVGFYSAFNSSSLYILFLIEYTTMNRILTFKRPKIFDKKIRCCHQNCHDFVGSFFFNRFEILKHFPQEASKKILVQEIKMRLPWRYFRWKRLVPNKVYIRYNGQWMVKDDVTNDEYTNER